MIIDLQNVTYRKNGKTILDSIDWQVEAGEHWIILGLNGSGKTTLLNLINGYIFPCLWRICQCVGGISSAAVLLLICASILVD